MAQSASSERTGRATFLGLGLLLAAIGPALAQSQHLIPTPFPETLGGNAAPLDPTPFTGARHQSLNADPYPQTLGVNAQGNPPIARRHRHQHLVPNIRKRKYRVDY
ncbi:MAG: hypothetical protein QOH98_1258 [Methylobacteriaceae bacterium]|jgi:hypothetical protein|nr:hypothetical protein [Methylobacteriaceae bacterium]